MKLRYSLLSRNSILSNASLSAKPLCHHYSTIHTPSVSPTSPTSPTSLPSSTSLNPSTSNVNDPFVVDRLPSIASQEHDSIRKSIRKRIADWNHNYGENISKIIQDQEALYQASNQQAQHSQEAAVVDWDSEDHTHQDIRTGSLVEISQAASKKLAVVVYQQARKLWAVDARGRLLPCEPRQIEWYAPTWISPSSLQLLAKYAQANIVNDTSKHPSLEIILPSDIAAPLTRKIATFESEYSQIYRNNSLVLDNCHSLLADKHDLRHASLSKITQALLKITDRQVSHAEAYATRQAMMTQTSAFSLDANQRNNLQMYTIVPRDLITSFDTIQEWIRQYRAARMAEMDNDQITMARLTLPEGYSHVKKFLKVARTLIKNYRHMHNYSPEHPPQFSANASQVVKRRNDKLSFNLEQSQIIRFLEFWALQRALPESAQSTLPVFLIRASGMYDHVQEITWAHGREFLKEIGVIPFWFNHHLVGPTAMIPCAEYSESFQSYYYKVHHERPPALVDSMESYRHDWGDLPVYCIDPVGTTEVDDGISIEKIPNEPDKYWLRMHIANPSAFLSLKPDQPTSHIAGLARQLAQTAYCVETSFPMLPNFISELCNIAPGNPCLTISAKLDSQGNVLDKSIIPSRVHAVKQITYSQVDELLGNDVLGSSQSFVVGTYTKSAPTLKFQELSQNDKENLSIMQRLAINRLRLDGAQGAFRWTAPRVEMSALTHPSLSSSFDVVKETFPSRQASNEYFGPPMITTTIPASADEPPSLAVSANSDRSARTIVSSMMTLAGSVAANWAWERGIPLLYRSANTRGDIATMEKSRLERQELFTRPESEIRLDTMIERMKQGIPITTSRPGISLTPLASQYAKLTSPLRRYSDLVNHWQIEAALRWESQNGTSAIVAPISSARHVSTSQHQPAPLLPAPHPSLLEALPFTATTLALEIPRLRQREQTLKSVSAHCQTHWAAHFFYRALHGAEAPSLDRSGLLHIDFPGVGVDSNGTSTSSGSSFSSGSSLGRVVMAIEWLGARTMGLVDLDCAVVRRAGGVRVGDLWRVRMVRVEVHVPVVIWEVTELASRLEADEVRRLGGLLVAVMNEPLRSPVWT